MIRPECAGLRFNQIDQIFRAADRTRDPSGITPGGRWIAAGNRPGIGFQLCAFTAFNNRRINSDPQPGAEVDRDVLLQIMSRIQERYVQIQP
jgi:hypothetical protein